MYEYQRDYGFDLPDKRYEWTIENEDVCSIHIVRNYYKTEDEWEDENGLNFNVFWKICLNSKQVMLLPEKTSEENAVKVAQTLYPEKDLELELREEVLENLQKEMAGISSIEFGRENENTWFFAGVMFEIDTYNPKGGRNVVVSIKVNKKDGKIFIQYNNGKDFEYCECSVFV